MIRLLKLLIKNFGNIAYGTVDLSAPVTVFAGDNGSGKSTWFKALYLNLLGTNFIDGSIKDFLNWNTGAKSFDIELEFEYFGTHCISKMHCTKSATSRTLIMGDEVITETTAVLERLKDMLDPKMFEASAIMKEGQNDVVTTTPAQRRDLLKAIYDLNFDEDIERLEAEKVEVKKRLDLIERDIDLLESKVYTAPESPEPLLESLSLDELNQNKQNLEVEVESYQNALRLYQLASDKVVGLKNSLSTLMYQKNTYISNITRLEKRKEEYKDILSETLNVEHELLPLKQEIERCRGLVNSVILPRIQPTLLRPMDDSQKFVLNNNIMKKQNMIAQLQNKIELAKDSICETCGQPLPSPAPAVVEALNDELVNLNLILESDNHQLKELNQKLVEHTRKSDEARLAVEKYNQDLLVLNRYKMDLERADMTLKNTEDTLEDKFKQKQINAQNQLDIIANDIANFNEEILNLDKEIKHKELDIKNAEATTPEKPHASNEELLLKIDMLKYRIDTVLAYNAKLKSIEEIKEKNKLEREKDQKTIDYLKLDRDGVQIELNAIVEAITKLSSELPNYMLNRLVQALEDISNNMLDRTYPKYNLKFKPTKKALKLTYGEQGQDVKLGSGYEKSIFSLCFKQSLSQSNGNKLLILDEMDSASSDDNSKKVYKYLFENLLGKYTEQILCITHKKSTLEYLQNAGANIVYMDGGEIQG